MIIVTGGAGFIGANFVQRWLKDKGHRVTTLDKLTYAGNRENLAPVCNNPNHTFVHGDINDKVLVAKVFEQQRPHAVLHFAAETHVDKSIASPAPFLKTNVEGTCTLLDEALRYWNKLSATERESFRFIHISTDEVFGSLPREAPPATEESPYHPNSPYSASKAAADHYVRAYHHTYGLPAIITHSSNNFGPYQFPEKLIPLVILNALQRKPLPIYGDGLNERNWLYVEDHCEALELIIKRGVIGEVYNIASDDDLSNIDLVTRLCDIIDKITGSGSRSRDLITFVKDRPGHDRRYALSTNKIKEQLGWKPKGSFIEKLEKTVVWYLDNSKWLDMVQTGEYRHWIERQYGGKAP